MKKNLTFRSSLREVFYKKGALKYFAEACNFIENEILEQVFSSKITPLVAVSVL